MTCTRHIEKSGYNEVRTLTKKSYFRSFQIVSTSCSQVKGSFHIPPKIFTRHVIGFIIHCNPREVPTEHTQGLENKANIANIILSKDTEQIVLPFENVHPGCVHQKSANIGSQLYIYMYLESVAFDVFFLIPDIYGRCIYSDVFHSRHE